MMRPSATLVVAALASAAVAPLAQPSTLHAQATVIQRDAPLDAKRESIKQELLVFRDTLQPIRAIAAEFARDTRIASDALARSRVLRMSKACAAAGRRLPLTRGTIEASKGLEGAGGVARQEERRTELLAAVKRLETAVKWCEEEFRGLAAPEMAEEARYGTLKRSGRLRNDLYVYDRAVERYLLGLGIRVLPLGARDPGLAG